MESGKVCGIILRVFYPAMGDTSKIEVLGKSMHDWVRLALGDGYSATVTYDENVPLPILIKEHTLKDSEYTVVLFSDTPLITRKTVIDAVYDLKTTGENVLKMTRGYVFRTEYLLATDKIYAVNHRFFEEEDFLTAFSFKQAAMVSDMLRNRILTYHMKHGVQFDDPTSTFVGCDVVMEKGVKVGANNVIKGDTIIKGNAIILEGNTLESAIIDELCSVQKSVVTNSYIGRETTVGPFAHIRGGCKIGDNCRIGNFVEIKNSIVRSKTKIAHLSYVGDADIGAECNIGCGTVFCNYDGKNKHKTVLGDRVFVGSNSNLVAPLTIENGAFIAAGSTITESVPRDAMAIARARQVTKNNYMKKVTEEK